METNLQRPRRLFAQPVRYEIPAFQRRYVWKQEEQWEPLWDDVEDLAQSIVEDRPKPHFMGAVVLQQTQFATATIERRIVVDGQQRLTTLQLLIDAIQEVLENEEHSNPAKRLSTLVTNGQEYRNGNPDYAFKVWPTTVDRDAFRHAMSNDLTTTNFVTSQIVRAHEYFKRQTEKWLNQSSRESSERRASALEQAVSQHLELVVIDLGKSDDPHIIFETLNARGTPLLQSDMVKNKILHEAKIEVANNDGETSPEEQNIWPFNQDDWWAQEVGRGLQRRPRVDVYLNHWLTLRNQIEMKPYDEFRAFEKYASARSVEANETIQDVARDMSDIGNIYRDVEEVRRTDISRFLERRNVMNVGVVTPLLLWLLSSDQTQARLTNCLTALESFLVRRVVCGYSARSYGELFVGLIRKLEEASPEDADRALVSYLGEQTAQATLWPSDEELRERFVTAPLYLTRGRLRMVLEGIEEALRTNKTESTQVPDGLHMEHVMPQTWHPNWQLPAEVAGDEEAIADRNRAIHTIGNLTLVNGRLNSSLSNAPWEKKRETLADHSVLFLNKRLVNKGPKVWDESAIKKRAKWLHKQAVKIWPHAGKFELV